MVEVTKGGDKMIVASIDKIHIINLEIKEQHSQVQKNFKCTNQLDLLNLRDVKINGTYKNMIHAIFELT